VVGVNTNFDIYLSLDIVIVWTRPFYKRIYVTYIVLSLASLVFLALDIATPIV
jgi:hypothetical protein